MIRPVIVLCLLFEIGFAANASPDDAQGSPLRIVLLEAEPGGMSSQQYCMLVLADHHFHAEKAASRMGKDLDRTVYEGTLSDQDWNALGSIIDSKNFREINVPPSAPQAVVPDAHVYSISVARDNEFQNMEFMDNKSRKPYEATLKPLLQWWRSVRSKHMPKSSAPPDARCAVDSASRVFSY